MEHEIPTLINVDLATCVSDREKSTYSPPRLTLLAAINVESGDTMNIAETDGGGLLSS